MNRNDTLLFLLFILMSSIHAYGNGFGNELKMDEEFGIVENESKENSGFEIDSIPYPWSQVDITAKEAKILDAAAVVEGGAFPWIPVIGGVITVGTVTYFLTKEDGGDPADCSFTASAQSISSSCGQSNGSISIKVNPSGDYSYAWSNGANGSMISDVPAGNYTVTITRTGTTCSEMVSSTITNQNPVFNAAISTQPSACDQDNGSATVTPSPPGAYTYLWSNGSTQQNQSGLASGNYTVTVSAGGECENSFSAQVGTIPFDANISFETTASTCGLSDGTATATADPPGNYTYSWSNGQTGAQATSLGAGAYNVTVSIAGTTCTQEASVTVVSEPFPYDVTFTTIPSHCGAADGSVNGVVSPQGEFGYQWSTGGSGAQLTSLSAGSYTVTITDVVTSCAEEFTVTVDELPAEIIISFTTTPAGCGISDGMATVMADPPGAYTYLWSTGHTTPQLSGVPSGTYSVTVTIMGTACSNVSTVDVEQAGGGFTATFVTDNADCGLANGLATITVDPPAEYMYAWSNQQTGPQLQQLAAGTYSVTVTDANSCTEAFSVSVGQDPADYISIVNSIPGNCTGGGEITFTLVTPGIGPLNIQIEGPQGTTPLSLLPGNYQLSAFITVLPGTYMITVYDEQIGSTCTEVVNRSVDDNTPPLVANDDFYTTQDGQPVFENASDNDSGLNIQMTDVVNEFGGTVTFNSDGEFTFTPDLGFSGDASFTYTVTDACGTTTTAIVTISVEQANCEFTATFTTVPASCGLEDGIISVEVIEPGSYTYNWSTGDSGPAISNIPAGTYTVTITDLNLGCDLAFTVDLMENPAEYISDLIITQPMCGVPGEIQFTVYTNSQNPLVMSVIHPNGSDVFFIEPDVIVLSDYITITPGTYTIEVYDVGAGPDCFESIDVTLLVPSSLEIVTEAAFPPTSPDAMDGFAIIVAIVPGILPYEILVNGNSWGVAIDNTFQVNGLGIGEYTIQIIDASGCMSNELLVIIPFPDIILSFGTGITHEGFNNPEYEPISHEPSGVWRSALLATMQYYIGTVKQELRMSYAVPNLNNHFRQQQGFVDIQLLSDVKRFKTKKLSMALQGGLGIRTLENQRIGNETEFMAQYWSLRTSADYSLGKILQLQGSIALRGWKEIQRPVISFSITIPFILRKPYTFYKSG